MRSGDLVTTCTVAPHTGAWIETYMQAVRLRTQEMSPLTQGRGLKRADGQSVNQLLLSPLTQGRGLKQLRASSC